VRRSGIESGWGFLVSWRHPIRVDLFVDNETILLTPRGAYNISRQGGFAWQRVNTTSCVHRDFEMRVADMHH
jgi:hypothetical protein